MPTRTSQTSRWNPARLIAMSIVLTGLLAVVLPPSTAGAQAGYGWVKADFASQLYSGETVVGTEQRVTVHHSYLEKGKSTLNNDQFIIKQKVLLSNNVSGDNIFISGGYFNNGVTGSSDCCTTFWSFIYADIGNGNALGQRGATGGIYSRGIGTEPWFGTENTLLSQLRMRYHTACGFRGNIFGGNCSAYGVQWEHVFDFGNAAVGLRSVPLTFPLQQPYPVKVLSAYHGYFTFDAAPENDIHITTRSHKYYRLPECSACNIGQGSPWPAGSTLAWKSYQVEQQPNGQIIKVWQPSSSSANDPLWDVCSGASPQSSCGCFHCGFPTILWNHRWLPGQYWPVTWEVGSGFGSQQSAWSQQTQSAAQTWNAKTGFKVLGSFSSAGGKIPISAPHPWPLQSDWIAYTTYPQPPVERDYQNCQAGDNASGSHYAQLYSAIKIQVNLDSFDFVNSMVYTSPDYSSSGRAEIPMFFVAAHELGHGVGIDHNGNISGNNFDVMVGAPMQGYDHQVITVQFPTDNTDGVKCLFYRRLP